ncbi:MAG: HD domain-containing protein [Pirellulales bacterium]|nr:HD domain-containing protein [Pirellulales bacterium]
MPRPMPIVPLSEMTDHQEADLFALMTSKQELTTRDGKPYFKVAFRDARREVSFPVWADSAWAVDCRDAWTPGTFYKIRATYRETTYGPQLDIRKIREVTEADAADGFDPAMCLARSRFDPSTMYDELVELVRTHVADGSLRGLVESILSTNHDLFLTAPAARHNHHAYVGGLLEHTLNVTRTCVFLAGQYAEYVPEMDPPLDTGLVVAGGALHDIGKLRELDAGPAETRYTAEGELIGHLLLGRDMVREAAAEIGFVGETLLRLEHLILSHQRLPEWGSPKPPMTPEALLVHYADDIDAKYHIMTRILADDTTPGVMTSRKNILHQKVFRGLGVGDWGLGTCCRAIDGAGCGLLG